jgi:hypothetical protein
LHLDKFIVRLTEKFYEQPLDMGIYLSYNGYTPTRKEAYPMGTEAERQDTRKAMAFDLFAIIDKDPAKETYTKEEMKKLIYVYVTTTDQK